MLEDGIVFDRQAVSDEYYRSPSWQLPSALVSCLTG